MPTYVYECKKCGKQFETQQRITEDPLQDCDCGGIGTLKRLIQPTAVLFKGAGFHINDYADKSASPASTPTAAASSTEAPSTDSKPDPGPASKPAETPAATPTPPPSSSDSST